MKWKNSKLTIRTKNGKFGGTMPAPVIKDCANPKTNQWRGSDNSPHLVAASFNENSERASNNHTCLDCQQAFKNTTICPNCKKEMKRLPFSVRVPRKGSAKWKYFKQHIDETY